MGFVSHEHLSGVIHIEDAMGVCCTLIKGHDRALLVDAGYGLEDVAAYVKTLTDLPVTLLLTHGHYDHAMGALWFDGALLHPADRQVLAVYSGERWRRHVLRGAADKGLSAPGDYLTRALPPVQDAPRQTDLGGRKVQILHVPGHTPGSLMLYLPDEKLLLTGDNWNPTTWLWYPEAEGAAAYLRGMRRVTELPFERALCSHRSGLYPRSAVTDFLSGLTAACLEKARPVELGQEMGIDTRECSPAPEQVFVFDADKVKGSDLQ